MAALINESDLAVATIRGEAESEGDLGRLAVAKVIRNRMRLRFFSDGTVAGTVLEPFQFSLWNTKEMRRIVMCNVDRLDPQTIAARQAWENSAEWTGIPATAVMYHTIQQPPGTSAWPPDWAKPGAGFREVARILRHVFYEKVS